MSLNDQELDNMMDTSIEDQLSPSESEEHCLMAEENATNAEICEMTARAIRVQEKTMDMEALSGAIVQVCDENDGQATMAQVMENKPPIDMAQYLFASLKLAGEKKVKLTGQRGQLLQPHELTIQLNNPQSEEN